MPIYVMQRRLGKGGFGQVWLGQRLINRKVTPAHKPNHVRHLVFFCHLLDVKHLMHACATF